MHEVTLLVNITIALGVAFGGGLIARRLGMPTVAGYLIAGVLIGPFTPGFVGDTEAISQLAEIGVIFLLFGVGIHFSLKDLWSVRSIVIPGGALQMAIATGLAVLLTQQWGWSLEAGLVLGLAVSIASTVVLLRGLMDNGLLNTTHGRVATGWSLFEDLSTIVILVLLPVLAPSAGSAPTETVIIALLKAAAFIAITIVIGMRVVPWVLLRIANTQSRELFILTITVFALGTAISAAEIFGVSIALGAFLAGVIVSESTLGYQAGAEVVPFQQIFAVLFFVSVGMLVDPAYVISNAGLVVALTALIVLGKSLIITLMGFIFPHPARTILVVAAGLSQIGEFSFIVSQAGLALGLLTPDQYSLILAAALLSIMINPLMFRLVPRFERILQRIPIVWRLLNHQRPIDLGVAEGLREHVVVIGYGRVGRHIVSVLGHIGVPHLVVEMDATRVTALETAGVPVLMGDAANSELLKYAGLERAQALVVTMPEDDAAAVTVALAHKLRPTLPIIVRASNLASVSRLAALGAQDVIHPELEGALEIMRHTLLRLNFAPTEVQQYADAVRHDQYDLDISSAEEHRALDQLIMAAKGMAIAWIPIAGSSPAAGRTIAEVNLRALTGASIVAMIREGQLLANPKSAAVFQSGDVIGVIGETAQVEAARAAIADDKPPQ